MFNDTGKRWLRVLWNCELRDTLSAGFLERWLGTGRGNPPNTKAWARAPGCRLPARRLSFLHSQMLVLLRAMDSRAGRSVRAFQ
jgi:hypothetical protein